MRGFGYEPTTETRHYQVRPRASGGVRIVPVGDPGTDSWRDETAVPNPAWNIVAPHVARVFNERLGGGSRPRTWGSGMTALRWDLGEHLVGLARDLIQHGPAPSFATGKPSPAYVGDILIIVYRWIDLLPGQA